MWQQVTITALFSLLAAGCAVERQTVVVASDACTRYGITASSADFEQCRQRLTAQRELGRVTPAYGDARIVADSQAACISYGVPAGSDGYDQCVKDEFAARRPG